MEMQVLYRHRALTSLELSLSPTGALVGMGAIVPSISGAIDG